MNVIGHDRACEDLQTESLDGGIETVPDRGNLGIFKTNAWVFQRALGVESALPIVRRVCKRPAGGDFRGGSELLEVLGPDVFRPRSARIVGEPESVRPEYRVICPNHRRDHIR